MGIFNFLKSRGTATKFVSQDEFQKNLAYQKHLAPQTMEQLRSFDVTKDTQLKLEFFFYTNSEKKAEALSIALEEKGYSVQYGKSDNASNNFIITGWTAKLRMHDDIVIDWTAQMCELGYQFDCDFDGWGTNPEQG